MKTRLSVITSAFIASVITSPLTQAANGCLTAPEAKATNIYFANGVGNTQADALLSLAYIKNAYRFSLDDRAEESYSFDTAYNYTQGSISDVIQVLKQKKNELGLTGIDAEPLFWLLLKGKNDLNFIRLALSEIAPSFAPDKVTEPVLEALYLTMADANAEIIADRDRVNAEHVSTYSADLLAGKRVIIFAHSQGNLFTNEAVRNIMLSDSGTPEQTDSIGVINIATPANSVVNQSPYVTAHDDAVISLISAIQPVLPSNIDNDPGVLGDDRDRLNHSFISGYFNPDLPSRAVIDDSLWDYVDSLPYPEVQAGEGAIRASLTWGENSDVDLHAIEPNGEHVYYANYQGQSGTLDVDNRVGKGPENYVVACEDIEIGTYKIGVNYYSGNTPQEATITLFLGNNESVTPQKIRLESARGYSGDSDPAILYRINVDTDEEGSIVYTVE